MAKQLTFVQAFVAIRRDPDFPRELGTKLQLLAPLSPAFLRHVDALADEALKLFLGSAR